MDLSGSHEASATDVTPTATDAPARKPVPSRDKAAKPALEAAPAEAASTDSAPAPARAPADSRSVTPLAHAVAIDHGRDSLLTEFGKDTLRDRYLLPGESYQDLFVRVASAYADDAAHAQRLYDYISKLWFMPATPVLSNGGTGRGLPISCYLNSVSESITRTNGMMPLVLPLRPTGSPMPRTLPQ